MSRTIVTSAVVIAALSAGGCATKAQLKADPEVLEMARKVASVAVLAPQVEVTQIVFSGDNERLTDEEKRIAGELTAKLNELVEGRHFTVRKPAEGLTEEQQRDAAFEIEQLQAAFTAAMKDEKKPEKEGFRPRRSAGPAATAVAARMGADAILLTRYSAFKKSGGQMAKDIMAGALLGALTGFAAVPASEGGMLVMTLIDGSTGEVLWQGGGRVASNAPAPNGSLYKLAESQFGTFPQHAEAVASTPPAAEPAKATEAPAAAPTLVPTSQQQR